MGKYKRLIISIVVVVAALLLIWFFFIRKKGATVTFTTEAPAYGHIATTVTATGTIQPVDTVAVGTQVSGTLKYLYADFNSAVKKGQLLGQLDQSLFQAAVDQYKGMLASAKSQLVFQQANYGRQEQLYKTGAISRADYDNSTYLLNNAKASVASNAAQLASAEKNLEFSNIYSPIDGVVLNRNVSVGQTVAASFSTPTLFVIARDITKMQVQASVDEADIGNVKDSQRVSFTVDAYLDDVFAGHVQEIRLQPTVSSNVVTYTTIINATNDQMKLKPGMTANVTIYTAERDSALLIPVRALKYRPDSTVLGSKYVLISAVSKHEKATPKDTNVVTNITSKRDGEVNYVWVLRGDTLQQKRIRTGLNDNTHLEVLHGLSPDDMVITGQDNGSSGAAPTAQGTSSPFLPKMGRKR
ncbi:efflux RND transporter periplasmic adaptor subunit [Chitinophaga sp. Cy-1792]|uniref:efflux RND transporter periplasmic adaptor subunit n=1 Tax=Chitinophaga sp. Cy-1792 TaxID=2608339 RepID=UPI00141F6F50|nr:efflux RND transporter periplasmic adaptor subunit [Chitinophaga sp. Cy-1792]NIG55150.1 efflux RND transporter periplasmic adaptor subunit [Chitinophaga sp. Cy-1792]